MTDLGILLSLAALASSAGPSDSELATRRFVRAVARGDDPVAAGLVASLTQDQSARLKTLRSCQFSVLGTSTKQRTRILWQCGREGQAQAWMTQLNFDGHAIETVEIVPLAKRPNVR